MPIENKESPQFRSIFGGLWTDLSNASEVISGKLDLGLITAEEAEQLLFWVEYGYIIIPNAVDDNVIDQTNADLDAIWSEEDSAVWIEHWENSKYNIEPIRSEIKDKNHKLLDLYVHSKFTRDAMFSEKISRFLSLIFDGPSMAFQSLTFIRGSQQPIHQDTAYVVLEAPMEFAASWIALENIHAESGPLEYFSGSHKMEEYIFSGGRKSLQPGDQKAKYFLESIQIQAKEMGLKKERLTINKGDALIWAADLAHGGSKIENKNLTRRSHVTHYCPVNNTPSYFNLGFASGKNQINENAYFCNFIRDENSVNKVYHGK